MSTPVALPAPKVFRLPRVRFKRPRWPKGDRVWLVVAVANLAVAVIDLATVAVGAGSTATPLWGGGSLVAAAWAGVSGVACSCSCSGGRDAKRRG